MYAYIKGEDNHLCIKRLNTRKEAEEWLKVEVFLYTICYKNYEAEILTDKVNTRF